jgi:putative FmdB family regulatory protein
MPIFTHRCADCGHAQDHLMKVGQASPACPKCAGGAYAKQLSAPAFALKGSGYYATDFKDKGKAPAGGCAGACPCHPSKT